MRYRRPRRVFEIALVNAQALAYATQPQAEPAPNPTEDSSHGTYYEDLPDAPPPSRQSSPVFDMDETWDTEYSKEEMQEEAIQHLTDLIGRAFDIKKTFDLDVNTESADSTPVPSMDRDEIPEFGGQIGQDRALASSSLSFWIRSLLTMPDNFPVDPEADKLPLNGSDFLRAAYLHNIYAREALPIDRTCSNELDDTCVHRNEEKEREKNGSLPRPLSPVPRLVRCHDCFGGCSAVVCSKCAVHDHWVRPFHRFQTIVEADPGAPAGFEFWGAQSFEEIGGIFNLGHGGKRCPSGGALMVMSIMDTNGIHRLPVRYCSCANKSPFPGQLLDTELFPASDDIPKTAFTFRLLKHYQMFNLVAKVSLHSYHSAMMYITNALAPLVHQALYNTLGTVTRQWRALRTLKHAGEWDAKNLADGSLAVKCAACPRPGENMELPEGWEKDPLQYVLEEITISNGHHAEAHLELPFYNSRLKYCVILGRDGNFHMEHQMKNPSKHIPSYVRESIFGDAGYWANKKLFNSYIDAANTVSESHQSERMTQCNTMAGNPGRFVPKKGVKLDITGIFAVSCRHGCVCPNGISDFHLGERYHYVDVAFCGPMQMAIYAKLKDFLITYDIACKYGINFKDRVTGGPIKLLSAEDFELLKLTCCVNKMHINGHKDSCSDNFSLNYTRGAGRMSRESVESIWPAMNPLQYQTREMTHGLQEEVLTDHFNHWNWRKRVTQAPRLKAEFVEAIGQAQAAKRNLRGIEDTIGPEKAETLRLQSRSSGGEQYRADLTKVPFPTRANVLQELITQENAQVLVEGVGGAELPSTTMLINHALKLESQQAVLQHHMSDQTKQATDARAKTIAAITTRVVDGLKIHYKALCDIAPQLATFYALEPTNPESDPILLPHCIKPPKRVTALHLTGMASTEAVLRVSICHEILLRLWKSLSVRSFLTRHSREFNGNNRTTRAQDTLNRAERNVKDVASSYNRCYEALKSLHKDATIEDLSGLQPLKGTDLMMLSEWLEGEQYKPASSLPGRTTKKLPWFWTIGHKHSVPAEQTGAEGTQLVTEMTSWEEEMIRLEFVHALAASDRWDEEVFMLSRELIRVPEQFCFEKDQWAQRVFDLNGVGEPQEDDTQETHRSEINNLPVHIRGYLAYATKQWRLLQGLQVEAEMCRDILPQDALDP